MNAGTVIESMIRLHEWRQTYNCALFGLGLDPYKPEEQYHYPEAYALWGQGYVLLSKLTGCTEYLQLAQAAAHWLVQHASEHYTHYSWGLPWTWERWNTPPTLSFLITTVFAGELFLLLYRETGEARYLSVAEDIAEWIHSENGGETTDHGVYLYYANHPGLRCPVINPTAKASGFYARLSETTRSERYRDLSLQTARWVLGEQKPNGGWHYSANSTRVDSVHTGFVIQGLCEAQRISNQEGWRGQIMKAVHFYWRNLFSEDGSGYERTRYGWREARRVSLREWIKDRRIIAAFGVSALPESRLWGYGSALRAFCGASYLQETWLGKSVAIYNYISSHLALGNGSYACRRSEPVAYIRHQGHVFVGMGELAQQLSTGVSN